MKTTFHTYYYDVSKPEDKEAYSLMCIFLAHQEKLKCFETWGGIPGSGHYFPFKDWNGKEIELETKHLFDNQWNTSTHRVFDWAQDYPIDFSKSIKRGHYLVQTAEMREIRRNTCACRYCGKQEPAQKGYVFCPHCLDSEYLKSSDLHLTRMKAIYDTTECGPLTQTEHDYLLPLYKEAQLHGNTERGRQRISKKRANIAYKHKKALANANNEFEGFTWLMDHGINTDNVIYYPHTGTFCFGWRGEGLDPETLSEWLNIASEFPFQYEIKKAGK
jgi:hypothetical protein